MSSCEENRGLLEDYLADGLENPELERLLEHLSDCPQCAGVVELDRRLGGLGDPADLPPPQEFAAVRRAVLRQIGKDVTRRSTWLPGWMAAAAALVLAFLTGYAVNWRAGESSDVAQLRRALTAAGPVSEMAAAKDLISNVTLRRLPSGRISIGLDWTRHLEMEEEANSPLVAGLTARVLVDQDRLGTRLKAVSLAGDSSNPVVEDALIFALRHDPHPAVRLRVLEVLTGLPASDRIEAALLETLRHDRSVQMRMLAVDYLVGRRIDKATIRQAVEEADLSSDSAVLLRVFDRGSLQ